MVVATTGSVNRFTRSPRRYLISVGQRSISAGEQVRLTWISDNGKNCVISERKCWVVPRRPVAPSITMPMFRVAMRVAPPSTKGAAAIRSEGGLLLASGDRLIPEPVLMGRDPAKLAVLAAANGDLKWSTDSRPSAALAVQWAAVRNHFQQA